MRRVQMISFCEEGMPNVHPNHPYPSPASYYTFFQPPLSPISISFQLFYQKLKLKFETQYQLKAIAFNIFSFERKTALMTYIWKFKIYTSSYVQIYTGTIEQEYIWCISNICIQVIILSVVCFTMDGGESKI